MYLWQEYRPTAPLTIKEAASPVSSIGTDHCEGHLGGACSLSD